MGTIAKIPPGFQNGVVSRQMIRQIKNGNIAFKKRLIFDFIAVRRIKSLRSDTDNTPAGIA